MKTNRDEILKSALRLFMTMNYERVSLQMVTEMVGVTKTGIFNYYSSKLELFVAVADKYLFGAQDPQRKFDACDGTLADFIAKYIQGVERTMAAILSLGKPDRAEASGRSVNAGYFHFLQQVLFYYPDGRSKLLALLEKEYDYWRAAIRRGVASGELRGDVDTEEAAALFRQVFIGLSFEMSFYEGLDIGILERRFKHIYSLLKR